MIADGTSCIEPDVEQQIGHRVVPAVSTPMLPTANVNGGAKRSTKNYGYLSTYFRRIVKPRQMDFE